MKTKSETFSFDNGRGQTLAGTVDAPATGDPLFSGVFAPCFTCTKESHAAHKICRALAARGGRMLRFDPTGLGKSPGDFSATTFSTYAQDIVAAARALANVPPAPVLLFGHSIGGPAALVAAQSLPNVKILATLGSPADPSHVVERLTERGLITFEGDTVRMIVAGYPITVRRAFVDDALSSETEAATRDFSGRLFVFHAPQDDVVNIRNAEIIRARAGGDAKVIPLSESATHLLERGTSDAEYIAEIVTASIKD